MGSQYQKQTKRNGGQSNFTSGNGMEREPSHIRRIPGYQFFEPLKHSWRKYKTHNKNTTFQHIMNLLCGEAGNEKRKSKDSLTTLKCAKQILLQNPEQHLRSNASNRQKNLEIDRQGMREILQTKKNSQLVKYTKHYYYYYLDNLN